MNKLTWTVSKGTRARDKRWARLISCIQHTSDFQQYCRVGNNSANWDCFRTLTLSEILKTQNRLREKSCIFGSHTFVPIRWMSMKQTSVSHSSTESEIISLDADLRMDGIPALDLWDLVSEVLHSSFNQTKKSKEKVLGDLLRDSSSRKHTNIQSKTQIQHNDLELSNVDYVSSNVKSSHSGTFLKILKWRSRLSSKAEV